MGDGMLNLRVAVDLDGVLSRTMDAVCRLINYRHGTAYKEADIDCWDFWAKEGLDESFWQALDLLDGSGLRRGLKPYDDHTFAGFAWLLGHVETVDVLTANRPEVAPLVRQWLAPHLVEYYGCDPERLTVKCLGRVSSRAKLALPYDVFIDDAPALAEAARGHTEAHPEQNLHLLLADSPWNQHVHEGTHITRFRSWALVPALIQDLARTWTMAPSAPSAEPGAVHA